MAVEMDLKLEAEALDWELEWEKELGPKFAMEIKAVFLAQMELEMELEF